MTNQNNKTGKLTQSIFLLVLVASAIAFFVSADPSGSSITYNITDSGATATASNRTDAGGTITSLILDAVQQNSKWKAYVGNITGALTLDDSNGNTIFDWSLSAAGITGEIYASRSNSPSWSLVNCSTPATIATEHTAIGFNPNAIDSINATFNETTHAAMVSAGKTIAANTCNSTSTYVNSTRQAQASSYFPELLLHDTTNLIYATPIRQDTVGFNNLTNVDFQMIVADDPTVTSTTYFFYAEIG
jgi:hypothetical protein